MYITYVDNCVVINLLLRKEQNRKKLFNNYDCTVW